MQDKYDVIIIGSGFGGAVTALRLAEQGFKVLVLERGRRWTRDTYPRQMLDLKTLLWRQSNPAKYHGWVDFRWFRRMVAVQGAGVGGGSLIYANVCIDARREVFNTGWPSEITYDALEPYYTKVSCMLHPRFVPPTQVSPRFRLVKEAARVSEHEQRFQPVPVAITFDPEWRYDLPDAHDPKQSKRELNFHGQEQGTCIHCGACVIGCPVGARNTLDLNYLAEAERLGTTIKELHLVKAIEPNHRTYTVRFDVIDHDRGRLWPDQSQEAPVVVLAAGSLGSTELLLRCRDQYKTLPKLSRYLGYNWGSNGDLLTPAIYLKRKIHPSIGPTISCAIDYHDQSPFGEQVFVEDGGFPEQIFGNVWTRLMPWFGQSVDAADARLFLRRSWVRPQNMVLDLYWKSRRSKAVFDAMALAHRQLTRATGGWPLPFTRELLGSLITPHPLGGCNMGTTPANGVVDHRGAVFGYPGLYVADGAIIPKAIGRNPSKTIAALAERTAELFIGQDIQ